MNILLNIFFNTKKINLTARITNNLITTKKSIRWYILFFYINKITFHFFIFISYLILIIKYINLFISLVERNFIPVKSNYIIFNISNNIFLVCIVLCVYFYIYIYIYIKIIIRYKICFFKINTRGNTSKHNENNWLLGGSESVFPYFDLETIVHGEQNLLLSTFQLRFFISFSL